ncbi:MAG: cupin domain-containing protein [Lyngbya sp.]|nr:cupin domain-containing protein [Lyngbya sp.]
MMKIGIKNLSTAIAATTLSALCFGMNSANAQGDEVLIVPPDASNRPTYSVFTGFSTFLAVTEDTGGAFSLFDLSVSPETGPPPHRHSSMDEAFYVLDGEVVFTLGNETYTATPGTFAYIPRGRRHGFANPGTERVNLLAITTPSGFEGFFQEEGGLVVDPNNPPQPRTDFAEIAPIAARYDTQLALEPESEIPPETDDIFLVTPDLAGRDSFSLNDSTFTFLASEEETNGQFELFNVFLPSQGGFDQLQKDSQQANSFYIREGEVTFWIGDETTTATANTFVYIPAGTPFAYQNLGDTQAQTLLLSTPQDIPEPATALALFGLALGATRTLKRQKIQ